MNDNESSRIAAVIAYLPLVGWLYVYLFQRKNPLALFHLRQSVGLCLFVFGSFFVWVIVGWLLSWIPLMATVAATLFTLVIVIACYGILAWIMGIANAATQQEVPLPVFGNWANRLPIK